MKTTKTVSVLWLLFVAFLNFVPLKAQAFEAPEASETITVSPQSTARETTRAFQTALETAKEKDSGEFTKIVLESGKTYQIDETLQMYSNTMIEASGAVVEKVYTASEQVSSGMLGNAKDNSKGGYDVAENIYLHGGTWTGGNLDNATARGTNFIFAHVDSLYIWEMDIKNVYGGHLMELNAVNNAVIEKCSFSGFKSCDGAVDDIALQLDIASEEDDRVAVPDHESAPSGFQKDGTPCKNISVINNTFNTGTDEGLEPFREAVGTNKLLVEKLGVYTENITIAGNQIVDAGKAAILATGYKNSRIADNIITNAGSRAILAECCYGGEITGNVITEVDDTAVYCFNWASGADAVKVEENKITNVGAKGIVFENAEGSDIMNNTVEQCGGSAFVFMKNSKIGTIEGNIIKTTGNHGIYCSNSHIETVKGNDISDNSDHGIALEGGSAGSVTGNMVRNCGKSGILVSQNGVVTGSVENNTISNLNNENSVGIYIYYGKVTNAIRNNTISDIGKHGIYIENGSVDTMSSNAISNIKNTGIAAGKSTFRIMSENTIQSSARGILVFNGSSGTIGSNSISECKTAVSVSADSNVTQTNSPQGIDTVNEKKPEAIRIPQALTIGLKESVVLSPVVLPENAKNKTVTFSSANAKIVSVNEKGKIQGKKKGSTIVTVQTSNGIKASVKVTVKKAPSSVALSKKKKTLKTGKSYKPKVKFRKGTASFKITWKSSRKKIASVSSDGTIKALKKGKAVITATTYNRKKAKITIIVK